MIIELNKTNTGHEDNMTTQDAPSMISATMGLMQKLVEASPEPNPEIWKLGDDISAALTGAWQAGYDAGLHRVAHDAPASQLTLPDPPRKDVAEEQWEDLDMTPQHLTEAKPEQAADIPSDDWLLSAWPRPSKSASVEIKRWVMSTTRYNVAALLSLRDRAYGTPRSVAEDSITREKLASQIRHIKEGTAALHGQAACDKLQAATKAMSKPSTPHYTRLLAARKAAKVRGAGSAGAAPILA